MKKLLLGLCISLNLYTAKAQNIDFTLEWNDAMSRYEVYLTRDIDAVTPFTNSGTSRIAVAFPTDPTLTVSHTNHTADIYASPTRFTAPGGLPDDFFGWAATGGNSLVGTFTAGNRVLFLSFTTSQGCVDGMRMYVNGSDPDSSASGMSGVDITQGYVTLTATSGIVDEYAGNTGGDPTCPTLGVEDDYLDDIIQLYPNPTSNLFAIKGLQKKASVSIYGINGSLVFEDNNYISNAIDVSHLSSGVYFIKMTTENGELIKKLVKQ
ncbi:MAG: T9SS type A sorting domain-containing protein [Flavobacteriaceae bacterium]